METKPSAAYRRRDNVQDVLKTSIGTIVALLLGLGAQMVIAAEFGAGKELDAYYTALTVPNALVALFSTPLSLVFIPAFINQMKAYGKLQAWSLAANVVATFGGGLLLAMPVTIVGAKTVIRTVAPGLEPATSNLAAKTLAWVSPIVILSFLSNICVALSHVHGRFGWPAIGRILQTAVFVIVAWPLAAYYGVVGLGIALLIGHCIQLTCLIWSIRGYVPSPAVRIDLENSAFRRLVKLWAMLLMTTVLSRFHPIIERFLASQLVTGSISYLAYANMLTMVFNMAVPGSVSTVLFPIISSDMAAGDVATVKETLSTAIRVTAFIALPLLTLLLVLRYAIVGVLLERGSFGSGDSQAVATALAFSVGIMFAPVIGNFTSKVLYSMGAVHFLAFLSVSNTIVLFCLGYLLMRPLGYLGIALAGSLARTWPLQLAYLRWRLGPIGLRRVFRSIGLSLLSALIMGGIVFLVSLSVGESWPELGKLSLLTEVVVLTGLGMVCYAGITFLLGMEEARIIGKRLLRYLRK